ncbi:MAG: prephenate dehydrogenase [Christensenellaceae bacterium]|jgi:prephenate dehydrogenase
MKIGIVGLGLIGGSVAKAIRKNMQEHTIVGLDMDDAVVNKALEEHVIDEKNDISSCDLVFVCLYPKDSVEYIRVAEFKKEAIVTDMCGIKRYVAQRVKSAAIKNEFCYIGSHPMAGKEVSGYAASDASLFDGASYILTCDSWTDKEACAALEGFVKKLGFGRVIVTTAEEHDRIIAYTSQLAHVVSNAYIMGKTVKEQAGFTAGSFEDLTRVAKVNPKMWAELFTGNADFLTSEIDELILHLNGMKTAIAQLQEKRVFDLLEEGNSIKEKL